MDGIAELDTEESAQDWRKELLGLHEAFLHSQRLTFPNRRQALSTSIDIADALH